MRERKFAVISDAVTRPAQSCPQSRSLRQTHPEAFAEKSAAPKSNAAPSQETRPESAGKAIVDDYGARFVGRQRNRYERDEVNATNVRAEKRMLVRPLTIRRLLTQCAILAGHSILVVIARLKAGAVEVSFYGLGRDLIRVMLHHGSEIKSDYGLIVMDIRLPRILLAYFRGRGFIRRGYGISGLASQSLGRSLRAGSLQRGGARRDSGSDRRRPH